MYYEKYRNGREAAVSAGYKKLAGLAAVRLLLREDVRNEIRKISCPVSSEEICAGYRRLAFGSVADAVKLMYADEMPDTESLEKLDLFNVSDIKRPKGGGIEIKFFDRLKALEHLEDMNGQLASSGAVPFYDALEHSARALNGE
ncbi:MAG: terminase small subunit [Clostridiales bacterium]|nr:terminase small subunit [Clostridiales bacterium]